MSEKLISADRLIQFVENWGKHHGREEAADSFLYAIRNAPAVDAVEVVRCKDCKYWVPMDIGGWMTKGRIDGECRLLLDIHSSKMYMTKKDHFCSYGRKERRQ